MPAHIAVFSYAAVGHVTPLTGIVEELTRRGHRATWVTTAEFADRVEAAGAKAVLYQADRGASDTRLGDVAAGDAARLSEEQFGQSVAAADVAETHFTADRPDLVLYDTTVLAPARLIARKLGVPAVQLFPSFVSNSHFSMLEKMPEMAKMWAESGIGEMIGARLADFIRDHGLDVPVGEFFTQGEPLNLAVLPKAFQYEAGRFTEDDNIVFVGPCLGSRADDDGWTPPESGLPVVLISLGSLWYERGARFLRECVDAFSGTSWHVVMSTGRQLAPEALGPLPSNMEARHWLPQTAVLRHASTFVTHAGMGGATEGLFFGVPMVASPQMPEQVAVARRLAEVGVGVYVPPDDLTGARLLSELDGLVASPQVRARANEFRELTRAAGGARRAADEIEHLLAS